MQIGSEEHKELFCRSFISSHIVYEPTKLPWPVLDETSLARLRGIPVWSMALQVELNAGTMVNGFAQTQNDVTIREAIRLQGYEEDRHARMIATLSDRYDLSAVGSDPTLSPTRRAFIDFGYNECLDSFLGFGIFRLAREAEFLPQELTSLFARVLIEEARHIVFFVNWISYERARRGYGSPLLQAFPTAIGYVRALMKTLGRANAGAQNDVGFAAAGDVFAGLTLTKLLQACIAENETNMAMFDPRLVRPRVIPKIAKFALRCIESGTRLGEAARSRVARPS